MERLPQEVLSHFMKGEHVMHHSAGLWNGIWSDMMIETTFVRYGHAPGVIVGITLKPETLKVWALSLHACSRLKSDLDDMTDEDTQSKVVTTHKEEAKVRIAEAGVSLSLKVRGGQLKVGGGRNVKRKQLWAFGPKQPRGVWGHAPPDFFEF
jgi:hypothetical protein